jgi:hypothetical protein
MKSWLLIAMAARLGAQTAAPAAAPQTKPDTGAAATSPVPSAAEPWITGSLDVGYRWRTDIGGSFDTYRSIVNLGSGPKLLGADFTVIDPKHRVFDRIDVRAYSWGGDPYGTFHLHAVKKKLYDFNADYRDMAYFNFLPSFADPLLARGIILDQQSFDTRRRFASLQLELLPGNWFVPYFGFDRDTGSGTGVATFFTDANQFPVPNRLSDKTNLYRGGIRFEWRRLHGLVEQGGTTFKDDESLYQASGVNFGDVNTPVLGQTLFLNSVLAAYGIRATSIYSKAIVAYNPLPWLNLYGQFLYSRPDSSVNYQQSAAGNLLQRPLLFYNGQLFVLGAEAKMPHTTGNAGAEIRLRHKIRVTQSWLTDRLDNAGSAASSNNVFGTSGSLQTLALLTSQLSTSYNKVQTDVFWEVYSHLTLHAGYRYEWGDASQRILPPEGLASADDVDLRRNVVLGGFTFQPWQKLTITGEAEGAPDDQAYFRTSLHNYQKARAQVRYRAAPGITVSGDFNLLNNQNPAPDVRGDYLARQASISLLWSPNGGKRFDVLGSYTRTTLRSDILILQPQDLRPQESIYNENAHTATALCNLKLPHARGFAPKITAGGSLFISSGSRPTRYYQPTATVWLPAWKDLKGFAEWRYYGFGEPFYPYEDFHAHTITIGVRVMR